MSLVDGKKLIRLVLFSVLFCRSIEKSLRAMLVRFPSLQVMLPFQRRMILKPGRSDTRLVAIDRPVLAQIPVANKNGRVADPEVTATRPPPQLLQHS